MTKLHNLGDYAAIARSDTTQNNRSILPDVYGPVQQISRFLPYQSYFDDTLLEKAILVQSPNEPIVRSTLQSQQTPGYAVGLHPSSQTPVAVLFNTGAQPSASQAIILKPGQIVRPHGLPPGARSGSFAGFQWGLPFGWLGGGVATILVFPTPDVDVAWPGMPEIIFHRQRMQILDQGSLLQSLAPKNWPLTFPWDSAVGNTSLAQGGAAAVAIEPTKVLFRLRLTSLANPATMRVVFQATEDFDIDSSGNPVLTPCGFIDHTWGSFTQTTGTGFLNTAYEIQSAAPEIVALGATDGGVRLFGLDASLANQYVDVVRYGRL